MISWILISQRGEDIVTSDNDVPWLHLLNHDYPKTALDLWLAIPELATVDLSMDPKFISLSLITATLRAFCEQGKVIEEEVHRDQGIVPGWKLAREKLDIPLVEVLGFQQHQYELSR